MMETMNQVQWRHEQLDSIEASSWLIPQANGNCMKPVTGAPILHGTAPMSHPGLVGGTTAAAFLLLYERERESFTSPFSQHWLMRTRLCWSHQPH